MTTWNNLSNKFNTNMDTEDIDPKAADNIFIAWPSILEQIQKHFPNQKGLKALDYGCGTGSFCRKLHEVGFETTGIDISEEMINEAGKSLPTEIELLTGTHKDLPQDKKYHVITAIMVLQFINDIEEVVEKLISTLEPDSILLFAVFNPEWVTDSLKKGLYFKDFEDIENPTLGKLFFGNTTIPVFIRTAEECEKIMSKYHMKKIFENYPPFTKEFLEKFDYDAPTEHSEYLIQCYKKSL